jgi:hypothetical protein
MLAAISKVGVTHISGIWGSEPSLSSGLAAAQLLGLAQQL